MTVMEAISMVRTINETNLPDSLLCRWLAEHDGRVMEEDYLRPGMLITYDEEDDEDTVLLIAAPYDEMYLPWLQQKIHFWRGEYEDAANCKAEWNTLHGEWIRHILNTRKLDRMGRPILWNLAYVRRGSNGVVHMLMTINSREIESVQIYIRQEDESVIELDGDDENVIYAGNELTVELTAEQTALLAPGGAGVVTVVQTKDGRTYESDLVQLRVLQSALAEDEEEGEGA